VVLIGFRGSGKTAVGRALASRLGCGFLDTDDLVEAAVGRSIADIFAAEGEGGFRDIEARTIAGLDDDPPRVISVGGGAVLRDENAARLRSLGVVIWLTAPAETLWARICDDERSPQRRPNLTPAGGLDEVRRLLAERSPRYGALADHVIDTAPDLPDVLAAKIERLIRGDAPIDP
jgi:shikimate kinase